jgi:hypothetical protein
MIALAVAGLGAFAVALSRAPAPAAKAGLSFVLVCLLLLSIFGVLFFGAAALIATHKADAFGWMVVPIVSGVGSIIGLRWLLKPVPEKLVIKPKRKQKRRARK